MDGQPTLLLVHGAWMGIWQWDFLAPELDRLGLPYATVALPSCGLDPGGLGNLADDARAVQQAIAQIPGDVVILAHSYAGMVATESLMSSTTRHVIYLGAFMPDTGRSLFSYLPPDGLPPFVQLRDDGATNLVKTEIPVYLCNACPDDRMSWLYDRIQLQSASVIMTPVSRASWHTVPSIYVVLSRDRTIPADLQRVLATQATSVIEIDTDHMPMLSAPNLLAQTLAEIVDTIGDRTQGATQAAS